MSLALIYHGKSNTFQNFTTRIPEMTCIPILLVLPLNAVYWTKSRRVAPEKVARSDLVRFCEPLLLFLLVESTVEEAKLDKNSSLIEELWRF